MTNSWDLSLTMERLFLNEYDAYAWIDEKRQEANVETSNVKYHKPTKKKMECWVATVKVRIAAVADYVSMDGEE